MPGQLLRYLTLCFFVCYAAGQATAQTTQMVDCRVVDGTLLITGNDTRDFISIYENSDVIRVRFPTAGHPHNGPFSKWEDLSFNNVNRIDIRMGGSDDSVEIHQFTHRCDINIRMETGDPATTGNSTPSGFLSNEFVRISFQDFDLTGDLFIDLGPDGGRVSMVGSLAGRPRSIDGDFTIRGGAGDDFVGINDADFHITGNLDIDLGDGRNESGISYVSSSNASSQLTLDGNFNYRAGREFDSLVFGNLSQRCAIRGDCLIDMGRRSAFVEMTNVDINRGTEITTGNSEDYVALSHCRFDRGLSIATNAYQDTVVLESTNNSTFAIRGPVSISTGASADEVLIEGVRFRNNVQIGTSARYGDGADFVSLTDVRFERDIDLSTGDSGDEIALENMDCLGDRFNMDMGSGDDVTKIESLYSKAAMFADLGSGKDLMILRNSDLANQMTALHVDGGIGGETDFLDGTNTTTLFGPLLVPNIEFVTGF